MEQGQIPHDLVLTETTEDTGSDPNFVLLGQPDDIPADATFVTYLYDHQLLGATPVLDDTARESTFNRDSKIPRVYIGTCGKYLTGDCVINPAKAKNNDNFKMYFDSDTPATITGCRQCSYFPDQPLAKTVRSFREVEPYAWAKSDKHDSFFEALRARGFGKWGQVILENCFDDPADDRVFYFPGEKGLFFVVPRKELSRLVYGPEETEKKDLQTLLEQEC